VTRGDRAPEQQIERGGSTVAPFVFHGAQTMTISESYPALRERALIAGEMFQLMLELHALRASLKYNADQPRAPAGQPDGGRWVGGRTNSSEADVLLAGGIDNADKGLSVQKYVSSNCKAVIYEVLPGEFLGMTIFEVEAMANAGSAKARTCLKLLKQDRFRK
jgi:hypothetical protein